MIECRASSPAPGELSNKKHGPGTSPRKTLYAAIGVMPSRSISFELTRAAGTMSAIMLSTKKKTGSKTFEPAEEYL
jgi:hypothetical protein